MQKVQPAKNNLDMDFLNSMDRQIGEPASVETAVTTNPKVTEEITKIDTSTVKEASFIDGISFDEDSPVSKNIKATQIVVRTTEKERDAMKSYFMKHGVSLSKGIKIAINYLEQQEKRGKVQFSDIGIYDSGL